MSNIPISSLPIAISLTGSEPVPLVQAGTTKTATVSLINASNIANIPAGGLTGQGLVKQSNTNYDTTWKTVQGFGTVQEVDTGTGLTGGPVTVTGTVSLAPIATHTLLANVTAGSAAPIPNTPSAVLDTIGAAQGDILYRDTAGWQVLAPGTTGQILKTQGAGANPVWSATGAGSVTSVGLALPSIFTVSGSPVTVTGTLTGTLATQTANTHFAGPATGAAAVPTFRALVGADLPNPSPSTLGGVQSAVAVSHQWINSISTSGVPALSQPAFTDISGVASAAQLPTPTTTTLGGIQAINPVTSNWIRSISTSGVPQLSQPTFTDISGSAALSQLPSLGNNAILSNISGGSATPLGNTLSSILDSSIAATQGEIIYRNATTWVGLNPGASGQVLTSGGTSANPSWATVSGTGTVTNIATNNGLTGGPITTTGTIGLATIATGNVLANTTGATAVPAATSPSAVLDVIGNVQGDILYRSASVWAVLAPGTAGQHLQTGGAGSTPSWANSVTSVATGSGLTGGTITTTGTIAINPGTVPGITSSVAAAAAGIVGEVITSSATTTALTSGTGAAITSITLTAGDWDISFTANGTTSSSTSITDWSFVVSTTSASTTPIANSLLLHERVPAEADHSASFAHTAIQVLLSASTTYFLNVVSTFTGTAPTATGILRARRMR